MQAQAPVVGTRQDPLVWIAACLLLIAFVAFVTGFWRYLLYLDPGAKRAEWASAIGSLLAVAVAGWLAVDERRKRRRDERLRQVAERQAMAHKLRFAAALCEQADWNMTEAWGADAAYWFEVHPSRIGEAKALVWQALQSDPPPAAFTLIADAHYTVARALYMPSNLEEGRVRERIQEGQIHLRKAIKELRSQASDLEK